MPVNFNLASFLHEFTTIFAVIDPIGTIPVYIAATAALPAARRTRVALHAIFIAAIVLLAFIAFGQIFLDAIGTSLIAFQIAGGIVLFLFALTMIFGESKPDSEMAMLDKSNSELAVYPLAIPSIASPGAMLSSVLLTDNRTQPILEQIITAGIVLLVLVIVLALMLLANPIQKIIGNAGAAIISRVMGLILAALAVDTILTALTTRFGL